MTYGLAFAYTIHTHDYYSLMLVPMVGLSLAAVASVLEVRIRLQPRAVRLIALLLVILSFVPPMWNAIENLQVPDYRGEPKGWARLSEALPKDGPIIALTREYGYRLLYYGWTKVAMWPYLANLQFAGLFAAACMLNVVLTLNYGILSPEELERMLALPALQREAHALPVTVPPEYAMALELVPADAILGYNVHGNGFSYPLYRADYSQHLDYVPIPPGSTCGSVAEAMETRGTRYLFVAPVHTEDWILSLLNECATEKDVLRERVRGLYVVKRD